MGLWFFSFFVSDQLAGRLAAQTEKIEKGQGGFHLLGGQADFFLIFVITPLVGAVALLALSRTIQRLMDGHPRGAG